MELNEVQIRYLLAILRYSQEDEIRSIDIANDMNDMGPTAHKRLESLIRLGLITKRKYRNIKLTEKGLETAAMLREQHRTVFLFFADFLGLDTQEAEENAYRFLGNLSQQSIKKLERYVRTSL